MCRGAATRYGEMLQAKAWRRPVVARSHGEGHRQASWLELLFDLSFVIAVAQAALQLEHRLAEGHPDAAVVSYLLVFAAIWWAWMSFTWFGNVFDTDDVPYRLWMLLMIAGSLGLAAGVPRIAELDFRIGVSSYVVMRLAYVAQWLRVLQSRDPTWRPIAWKVIVLTTLNQAGWVAFLYCPLEWRLPVFVFWFAADVATPVIAGWDARLGGHRGHIVERYGLFTLIVLGESIAAATVAVGRAVETQAAALPLLVLAVGGLVIVFSIWWIYFDLSAGGHGRQAAAPGRAAQIVWGYGHYFVFASLAAIGAGLALAVERLTERENVALPDTGVALAIGAAVAVFLLAVAAIEAADEGAYALRDALVKLGGALAALGAALAAPAPALGVAGSVLAIGLVLAAMVCYGVVLQQRMYAAAR